MCETDGLEKVTDFSAVVSERGNAEGLCHVPQTADVDGELRDRPGAGAKLRLCRDCAAPAGGVAAPPGVEADPRLRRDYAAPSGCKASGCSQVDVELDLFSSCFQPCMSPIDRDRLVSGCVARSLHVICTSWHTLMRGRGWQFTWSCA